MTGSVSYDDLAATVYLDCVPDGATHEIDSLYSCLFSTVDYFETYDDARPTGAVVLTDPYHLLLFTVAGGTVEVLNKAIDIAPVDACRACRALFRAFARVHRIHIEVMFPARQLGLDESELYSADDMVITLPGSLDDYFAMLGRSTRRNLRSYERRLRNACPDVSTVVLPPAPQRPDHFELYMAWKRRRLESGGETVYFDRLPDRVPRFRELLRRRGEVHLTTIDDRPVAIAYAFPVGQACYLFQCAHDTDLDDLHIGLLSQYWVIADALARGLRRVDMLWGTTDYKERLGAQPVRATRVSVFRSPWARLYCIDEAVEVNARRIRGSRDLYWRARHEVGRRARSLRAERLRQAGGDPAAHERDEGADR